MNYSQEAKSIETLEMESIMLHFRESINDLRGHDYKNMTLTQAIKISAGYILASHTKEMMILAIKNDPRLQRMNKTNSYLRAVKNMC
tara:strand:+ start:1545 stop:1805 length:261 start_codon:yes stop_codon:yes gene_type:complete